VAINKLTAIKVEKAKKPGMYGDGGGLYLRVLAYGCEELGISIFVRQKTSLDGSRAISFIRPR
jgi:hypothetical protein